MRDDWVLIDSRYPGGKGYRWVNSAELIDAPGDLECFQGMHLVFLLWSMLGICVFLWCAGQQTWMRCRCVPVPATDGSAALRRPTGMFLLVKPPHTTRPV